VDSLKTLNMEQWLADERDDHRQDSESSHSSVEQRKIMLLQRLIAAVKNSVKETDFWRIVIGNMIAKEDSKLHWLARFSSIHDLLAKPRWKDDAEQYRRAVHELQRWTPSADEPSPAIRFYLRVARKVCRGRKFFTTEDGRVGFGPQSMAVGDVMCIIKCTEVPFVLRQHPTLANTYLVSGEAYVQGLMYGEYQKVQEDFSWITLV
jgi:hypothetical protein